MKVYCLPLLIIIISPIIATNKKPPLYNHVLYSEVFIIIPIKTRIDTSETILYIILSFFVVLSDNLSIGYNIAPTTPTSKEKALVSVPKYILLILLISNNRI